MAAWEGFPYTAKAYTIDERVCENIRAAWCIFDRVGRGVAAVAVEGSGGCPPPCRRVGEGHCRRRRQEIGSVVELICSIVAQTNPLVLNAMIVAPRADERR